MRETFSLNLRNYTVSRMGGRSPRLEVRALPQHRDARARHATTIRHSFRSNEHPRTSRPVVVAGVPVAQRASLNLPGIEPCGAAGLRSSAAGPFGGAFV